MIPTHKIIGFMLLIALFIGATTLSAAPAVIDTSQQTSIDWLQLGMGLFGGLALFLAGLDMLSNGLKKAAGETLKVLLSKLTTNRFMGALTGAIVTGILNSSSVTTVLVVSFITAGVMTLSQSVGVIMGANIGSTMTAQLLAFNLSAYALLPIAIGFFMTFIAKREKIQYYGMMLMGLGLVFFGMGLMSDAMGPLRTFEPFIEFLKSMEKPMIGVLAGAIFTGLVQSSAATVGIAIAMASEGLLSLPAGIALAMGANIGTCVTAMMAAIGKPVEAVRAAIVHVLFNVLGVLLWLFFIPQLAEFATALSPVAEGESLASAVPRQIANANTLFNVINTIIFIGFTGWFARLAVFIAPEPSKDTSILIEPKYIMEDTLNTPSLALGQVRLELARMAELNSEMFSNIRVATVNQDRKQLKEIFLKFEKVNILADAVLGYLSQLRREELTEQESFDHQAMMSTTIHLQNQSSIIRNDIAEILQYFIDHKYKVSDLTKEIFLEFYHDICVTLEDSVVVIGQNDQQVAETIINQRRTIKHYENKILSRKSNHLGGEQDDYWKMARLEVSLMEKITRIYSLARSISKQVMHPKNAS
ncbi:MAG: Na/Pi cotransporter family protein [Gammaproteobacteria bacterium]|nr:Na/Pi cotransporter family protein [Gammaproteobacteria bacterium]